MNYYYPGYNNYPYTQGQMPSMQYPTYTTQSYPQGTAAPQTLNGKIVDSEDVVRATEVPIGGYGIFPKADLSEIYVKSWNNNGTTSLITFQPIVQKQTSNTDSLSPVLNRLSELENKIDMILNLKSNNPGTKILVQQQKEGNHIE